MKAYINDKYNVARFLTDSVAEACRVGEEFARKNPDLARWSLVAHRTSEDVSREHRREVYVTGSFTLADAIRQGPPRPRPSGFVGPFGEGK